MSWIILFIVYIACHCTSPISLEDCPQQLQRSRYLKAYYQSCYQFVTYCLTDFDTAHSACLEDGGDLVTIESLHEQYFVVSHLQLNLGFRETVWIGLDNRQGPFLWPDGSSPAYTNWALGENPQSFPPNEHSCVALDAGQGGAWFTKPCFSDIVTNSNRGYICEFDVSTVPLTTIKHPQSTLEPTTPQAGTNEIEHCEAGIGPDRAGKAFQGKCYRLHMDMHTDYLTADRTCKAGDGQLVVVKTKEVQDFLVSQLMDAYEFSSPAWIGLSDHTEEGHYVWADGLNLDPTTFSPWGISEGPGATTAKQLVDDCFALDPTDGGIWRGFMCDNLFGIPDLDKAFICEYKLTTPDSMNTPSTTLAN